MASIRKVGESWKAEVVRAVGGQRVRRAARFSTKAEAVNWAAAVEASLVAGKGVSLATKTVADVALRYAEEVSPSKRGAAWEVRRLQALARDVLGAVPLDELSESHIAAWRDRRLKSVSSGTVLREWNVLSPAFDVAVREWRWLARHPMREVRRPAEPPCRDRILTDREIELLCHALGYSREAMPQTSSARVGAAMLFAIESAMRAGEIVGLRWSDIEGPVARTQGKTPAARRRVPLSPEALRILAQLPRVEGDERCFQLHGGSLDALFRRAKLKAGIEGLHFHDTRATAITRLARKLDILDLARMVGHKDLRMLQVYYRDSAETIASRLAAA